MRSRRAAPTRPRSRARAERPHQCRRHGLARRTGGRERIARHDLRAQHDLHHLNAAGGLSGTFASVNELYPFLLSTLSYDANNAYLNLAIGGFAAAAATPTQTAVGNVLDANVNNATGDFATVLGAMAFNTFSNAQAQATLQAICGNNYAGFSTSMVQGAQLFMNNFANQTGGGGSPVSNRVALAEACDVACDVTTSPKWGAWGGALGGLGTIGATSRSAPSPTMPAASRPVSIARSPTASAWV